MATKEIERFKQILPKIAARLADKKDRLIAKMKELRIFEENVDIFITLEESNNFEILKYLKEMLRIEGLETVVRDIEGKPAHEGNYTENSTSSADSGSDSLRNDLESKSDPFVGKLQEMKQEMMKGFQEMKQEMMKESQVLKQEMVQGFRDVQAKLEESKETERKLLELLSKLEKDKDELKKELKDITPTSVDEARTEALQHKFDDLQMKYNQLLNEMKAEKKKMGKTEMVLRERNKQLSKEIDQLKVELVSMQVSKKAKGQMYTKLATPTRQKTNNK